jgi:predicted chitinase
MAITRDDLARMYPRALPEWLDALHELAPVLGAHYGFNRLDWVHFCGQIAAETNSLTLRQMRENMSFSTQRRILEVYSYRLGVALSKEPDLKRRFGTREKLAAYLVRKPKELADIVYGGREGTPWMQGSKYIGRGPTQITHRNNYKAVGDEIAEQPGGDAFDLVSDPDVLATDAELGIRAAFADWHIKGLSRWAQKDDCDTLSDALNTGNIRDNVKPHGLDRRRLETSRAKKIWPKSFTFGGAVPSPVPKPVPPSVPVPTTVPEIAKVSRKGWWGLSLYRVLKGMFAGLSLTSLLEYLGMAKEVRNEVGNFFEDHALTIGISVVLVSILAIRHILNLMVEDVVKGNYVPSKLAEQGAGPVGVGVEPPGDVPAVSEEK